jgi:solute:Na+ symporter, SSS family
MEVTAAVFVIYLMAMMIIGLMGKHSRSLEGFHLAKRSVGPLLLTGTFCATIIGASSTLGMAGLGFSKGWPGAWWMLSGMLGLLALSLFFAEKVRSTGYYTLPEVVGSFYGQRVRIAASMLIIISWIGVIAAQVIASGKVMGALFGTSETAFMIASAAVFVIYTAHGGQSSVIRTDIVQLIIILVGIFLLLSKAAGALEPGALEGLSFPTSQSMDASKVASMILVVGSAYLIGPDMYTRLLSAKNEQSAKRSAMASAMILVPLAFAITALGVIASKLFPAISPEDSIPVLMVSLLSPLQMGVVAAALLAAFMSSADTTLMTAASTLTLDLYKRIRPDSSDHHLLMVSKIAVVMLGGIALATALSSPNIIKVLLQAYTVYTGGMLIPVLAGFYRQRLCINRWRRISIDAWPELPSNRHGCVCNSSLLNQLAR